MNYQQGFNDYEIPVTWHLLIWFNDSHLVVRTKAPCTTAHVTYGLLVRPHQYCRKPSALSRIQIIQQPIVHIVTNS